MCVAEIVAVVASSILAFVAAAAVVVIFVAIMLSYMDVHVCVLLMQYSWT